MRGTAIIVAHGWPSEPERIETAIARLAREAADLLPGCRIAGATLAAPDSLRTAVVCVRGCAPVIYPMFMADGWFVREALPRRLRGTGCRDFAIAAPFGRDPAVWSLCLDAATRGAAAHGMAPAATTLLLAAHGSPSDPRPRDAAERAAAFMARAGVFRSVRTGYIDQEPYVRDAASLDGPAICLPFFATAAGHVTDDLPRALRAAGFCGALLDPIGTHPGVKRIAARAVAAELGDRSRQTTREGKRTEDQNVRGSAGAI